jgi:hypothetical protein
VGNESHFVAVPPDRDPQPVREFGCWTADLMRMAVFELHQAVDRYQFAHRQMQECDRRLEGYLASLPTRMMDVPSQAAGQQVAASKKAKKAKKPKGNAPALDLKAELKRICAVDLTSIDGIDVMTAQTVIAEIGPDMSAFPTENHLASWSGLTPSKDISGGKVIGPGRRKVRNRVAMALRMAASTLLESKSYLGGRYRHLRTQLPSKAAAVKAMARYLAVLVHRMLTKGEAWVDRGAAKFEQKRSERELASLRSKALAKGFQLTPITAVS